MWTTFFGFCGLMLSLSGGRTPQTPGTEPQKQQFTIVGIVVGEDTLKSVQKKVGPSTECAVSEHLTRIGYALSNETLLFEASDIGGGEITGFVLRKSGRKPACSLAAPKA